MIEIRFWRTGPEEEAPLHSFEVRGHAGYEEAGRDIICAAVSAVTQSTVKGLAEVVGCEPDMEYSEGFLRCRVNMDDLPRTQQWCVQVLMETLRLALDDIQEQYPDRIRLRLHGNGR